MVTDGALSTPLGRSPARSLYVSLPGRSAGGPTSWENIVTSCAKCNVRKASRPLNRIPDMKLKRQPCVPSWPELQQKARAFPPREMHEHWATYIVDYNKRPEPDSYRPDEGADDEYGI